LAAVTVYLRQFFGTLTPIDPQEVGVFLFFAVLAGIGGYAVVVAVTARRPSAVRASVRRPGPEAPRPRVP
jgi:hypothetical protein